MRTNSLFVLALLLTGLLPGCGGPSGPATGPASALGPHGSSAIAMPDGATFAEVVLEPASGPSARTRLVHVTAYFFDPQQKPVGTGIVTDVKVKILFPDGSDKIASLAADSKTPGRFISQPGDYAVEPLSGDLTATIGGSSTTIPFANPR